MPVLRFFQPITANPTKPKYRYALGSGTAVKIPGLFEFHEKVPLAAGSLGSVSSRKMKSCVLTIDVELTGGRHEAIDSGAGPLSKSCSATKYHDVGNSAAPILNSASKYENAEESIVRPAALIDQLAMSASVSVAPAVSVVVKSNVAVTLPEPTAPLIESPV